MCTQDLKLLDYKNGRLRTSRFLPDMQVSLYGCVSMRWGRKKISSKKNFAKQNNFNACFSTEERHKFC